MNKPRIHKDNYEAFLLDRVEGNLSAELALELDLFLIENPHLAIDTEDIEHILLINEQTAFDQKTRLKKSEKDLVSNEAFVAYIENQLSKKDKTFVEKSIANNPALQTELSLYQKTILAPDTSIVFEPKSALKRRAAIIWFNPEYTRYAAAAVILLFVGLVFMWTNKPETNHTLANTTRDNVQKQALQTNTLTNPSEQTINKSDDVVHVNDIQLAQTTQDARKRTKAQTTLANEHNAPVIENNNNQIATNGIHQIKQDSLNKTLATSIAKKEEDPASLSNNRKNDMVVVIEEADDDDAVPATKKKGLWAMAGKALKRLNKAGVKTVDGTEKESQTSTDYLLTLGGVNITHSKSVSE